MRYRDAGVDRELGDEIKASIKTIVSKTVNERVVCGVGGFGAVYDMKKEGLLVSSADSVGTKTLIARLAGRHHTIGQDIVSHCVNDILCHGAEPLFFLDYIASSKLEKQIVLELVEGMAEACKEVRMVLIGGETAEMPDVYLPGEYDLVGFIVGSVPRERVIDGSRIKAGDVVIGLPSSGLHTNGYSLARRVVLDLAQMKVNDWVDDLGTTVGEALLKPHRCYFNLVSFFLKEIAIHGIVHITGGGFEGNVPRVLPEDVKVVLDTKSWEPLPVFRWLQQLGKIGWEEMYRTFNMGMGMLLIIPPEHCDRLIAQCEERQEMCRVVGKVVKGERGVQLVR